MTTNARLRALVELAATGSVRAAAQRLVVTESSVSSAISALAAEIGVPLVDRDGRGVRLTPAGERYADYARRILGLHAEAVTAARGEADPEHGTVRIAAVTTAGEHMLPALLTSFRSRYPHVALGLEVGPRGVVWPMLAAHEVDLVVAGRPPDGLDARVRAVSPNTLVVVGPPALRDDFDPGHTTWLQRERGSGIRATAVSLLDTLDVAPPQLSLGSHGAVVAGAVAGLGVTLVSRQSVRRHLESGALVELPVPGTPMQRAWHVVSQPTATAATNLLVRHLLTHRDLGWRPADRPAGDD
ncbi:LysR family transcriptional regulator [Pseudonocardia benzenivorans]|uniref:Transcriptional regulator, LysR family n=2 Tax=Pseudonocardia TaxID=1847 RepID=F4CQ80_PSEUX|nr:LysR family transcriptional regulator [Pseudonocardia dioxanivorans]AEA28353.1 transcriptional regulator, LysR family [Pseudonocardia dioxanivorans CB1190]GJF05923.1 transcriptional regulator [Pseudonocardia sp. D17]